MLSTTAVAVPEAPPQALHEVPGARGRRDARAIVLVAAVVVVLITARLGLWQLDRAATKQALADQIASRSSAPVLAGLPTSAVLAAAEQRDALLSRRAVLVGHWVPGSTVFLENRQLGGRPGFYVVSALQLQGRDDAVVIQRGWVPRDVDDRQRTPTVDLSTEPVTIPGRLAPPPARLFDFAASGRGPIRQNLDLSDFAAELKTVLLPLSLQQTESDRSTDQDSGLQRDWPLPAVDVHKHHGYAFQWFALSALTAGLYVWFQILRPRR